MMFERGDLHHTRISRNYPDHLSGMLRSLPRRIEQVHLSISSLSVLPSPVNRRVGIHDFTFGACSSFTRVAACQIACPPIADLPNLFQDTFVTFVPSGHRHCPRYLGRRGVEPGAGSSRGIDTGCSAGQPDCPPRSSAAAPDRSGRPTIGHRLFNVLRAWDSQLMGIKRFAHSGVVAFPNSGRCGTLLALAFIP